VGTLVPRFDAEVKSEFAGRVAEVFVDQWVRVKAGSPLARVDTREGEVVVRRAESSVAMAKANLLESQAAANRADRELERAGKLKESGLITQQNLDDARTQKEAADARAAAARAAIGASEEDVRQAQTRLARAYIRAPFDGVVAERFVNVGEVVGDMQKVLFRIVDDRRLNLTLTLPSADLASVREGQTVTFTVDSIPGRTFTARLRYINPVVNDADRSVKAIAEVDGGGGALKGGLFVNARIATGKRTAVLRIPRGTFLTWDTAAGKAELYVVSGGVAHRKVVATGVVAGDLVEIVSGLAPGDDVILRGAFNVKDGEKVAVSAAAPASAPAR
ncbi:MAG TPA: efflux RND transporter periplasmic adaptor subunit, partial [Candidatus Deferrimicrobiaceae bacterium]